MSTESSNKFSTKDKIIIAIFFIIIIVNVISYIYTHGFTSISDLISQTILILLAFVGFIQIADFCHWTVFVPDFLIKQRQAEVNEEFEKRMSAFVSKNIQLFKETDEEFEKRMSAFVSKNIHLFKETDKEYEIKLRALMSDYFSKDINFFTDYNQDRISYIMTQLGISETQLNQLRLDLIKMRCMPLTSLDDAKNKIQYFVKSEHPLVITQKGRDSARYSYNKVRYYVNFIDPMFSPTYSSEIAKLLAFLIEEKANLKELDKLVIPHDSNFLLGNEVGRLLGKPVVKMRQSRGKIITNQHWDGNLGETDRVIIVHDVLVSGDQIFHALDTLPKTCTVQGVYCLITRKEWHVTERLAKRKVKLEQVICLNDDDIAAIRGEA